MTSTNPDHAAADMLLRQLAELADDLDVDAAAWIGTIDMLREMLGTLAAE